MMKDQEPIRFVSLKNITMPQGIGFFFTTRHGGESRGAYGGLNLGLHVKDDPKLVQNNRQMVQKALGSAVRDICFINQVHGAATITAPFDHDAPPPDADALVTTEENVALGIMTADCAPVLLADGENRVVGAAHAGWRGAVDGILESCIEKMQKSGAEAKKIHAVIGPAIHQANYEVGPQFMENFLAHEKHKTSFGCQEFFSFSSDKSIVRFDLPGYIRQRLLENRIPSDQISDVGLCTFQDENNFFSHRRTTLEGGGFCGRQMGGIFLRKQ